MTQNERVYDHLLTRGSINPLESWQLLGVYRLASRINELRKDHNIGREFVGVVNKYGETVRVAEYYLECDCPACHVEREQCRH